MTEEHTLPLKRRTGLLGVLVTAISIVAVWGLDRFLLPMPFPLALVLLAVVYATFVGGMMAGLVGAAMLTLFAAWYYSPPGGTFLHSVDDAMRVATTAVVAPAIVIMVGILQGRADRSNAALREKAALEARLAEREQIHAALEDSRSEQRNIFNAVPAMIWFKDAQGRILRANRLAAESIGRSVDEVIGRSTWDLYPEEAEKYQRDDMEVIRTGRPKLGIIERYETPSGSDQWVRTDKIPYRDENGEIAGVIVFAVDISDQKTEQEALRQTAEHLEKRIGERAEELRRVEEQLAREQSQRKKVEVALQHGEERLRTIMDNTQAVIYMKDLEGRYVLANRRHEKLFHLLPEGAVGKTDFEIFPASLAAEFRKNDGEVMASGQAVEFEEVAPHDDGLHTYISLKFPIYDLEGRVSGVCGISTDITDRKRAENATRARLTYEEGIAAVSRTLLAGVTTKEALQESLQRLMTASGVSRVYLFENFDDPADGICMRQTHEACAEGVTPQIDNPLLRHLPYRSGLERWRLELSHGRPIQGLVDSFPEDLERELLKSQEIQSILVLPIWSAGKWYGFIGFDDTKTKRLWTEEDIRLLRTAAEMIGAYIAREQADSELRKAKELAEAANAAKTRFLANVSHEIRTPIMAMLAAAELVRESESGLRPGEIILRNGRHLMALVNELLDVSRIEADRLTVRVAEWSLVDILRDVAAVGAPLHGDKPVDFSIEYLTAVPARIRTDRTRLTQALVNLINNALKFTERGRVCARIRVARDEPDPRLTVVVEDTGRGIAEAELMHIFEPFTQFGPQTGSVSEGVGLGLPIAKWIAEQLGGSLTARSELGRGSTFTMQVQTGPLDEVEWIPPERLKVLVELAPEAASARPRLSLRGRVLLAEDAPDARDLIESALRHAGATVTTVTDGRQAVEAHRRASEPFDLVLMDIRMPTMDGLAAATELRRLGCRSAIIAMTASTTAAERERILNAGFDDVWGKPISLDAIVARAAAYVETTGSPCPANAGGSGVAPEVAAKLAAVEQEFVRSLPERMRGLRVALESGDPAGAYDVLHRLVGTAGICGHLPISEQAARTMQRVRERHREALTDEVRRLEELVGAVTRSRSGCVGSS